MEILGKSIGTITCTFAFLTLEFQTYTDFRLRNNTYHFSKWRFHSQISCSRQTRGLLIYDVRSALYQGKHYLEVYYDRRTVCDPMSWNKRHVYSYDRKTCKHNNNSKIRLFKTKVPRVFILFYHLGWKLDYLYAGHFRHLQSPSDVCGAFEFFP